MSYAFQYFCLHFERARCCRNKFGLSSVHCNIVRTIEMCYNVAKQFLVIEAMAIAFSFCISPSHSLNVEQFTEDMVEYFGADLPIILFDRDAVTSPLSLKMAASFIEFDSTVPGMEAEVVKGSCSVLVHFSCSLF